MKFESITLCKKWNLTQKHIFELCYNLLHSVKHPTVSFTFTEPVFPQLSHFLSEKRCTLNKNKQNGSSHTLATNERGDGRVTKASNGSHIFPAAIVFRAQMIHCQLPRARFHVRELALLLLFCSSAFAAQQIRRQNKQMKRWAILFTESQVTTAVLSLLLERGKKRSGGRLREGEKKKSLLDPEIIARAKTYQECGSSGGRVAVYSLSEVTHRERHERGRERTSGSTAGGRGFAVE